jgi:chorismate mutase
MCQSILRSLLICSLALTLTGCVTTTSSNASQSTALAPLVGLLSERLSLMEAVAQNKWQTGGDIEDSEREAALLASIRSQARARGWAALEVEAFFRAQIEAAKELQSTYFSQWERARVRPEFEDAPNLAESIRPQIDELTDRIFSELSWFAPDLALINREQLRVALVNLGWPESVASRATRF